MDPTEALGRLVVTSEKTVTFDGRNRMLHSVWNQTCKEGNQMDPKEIGISTGYALR